MKTGYSKGNSLGGRSVRTTLSIPADLAKRLRGIAEEKNIQPMDVVRASLEQYVVLHEAGGPPTARHRREIIAESRELRTHYQNLVASWRLARASRQLSLISALRLELDAFPPKVYLLKVLMDLVARLDERDEFLVVTNLEFWKTDAPSALYGDPLPPEAADCYLFAQRQAIKRGMALSRILVLEEGRVDRKALVPHQNFLEMASNECPDCTDSVEVRVKYSKLAERELPLFACVRRRAKRVEKVPSEENDQECLIIEPIFSKARFSLRLLFSKDPGNADAATNEYIDHFFQARSNSQPLSQSLQSNGQTPQLPAIGNEKTLSTA